MPFLHRFNDNPKIRMVGPYISCEEFVHVQSPFFVVDGPGLGLIRDRLVTFDNGSLGQIFTIA